MKRLIASVLAIGLSLGTVASSVAEEVIEPGVPEFGSEQLVATPAFYGFTGKVMEIDTENRQALVQHEESGLFKFIFEDNTYFISGSESELAVGDEVTGYYDAKAPMLMIYPPQSIMSAVAVNYDDSQGFYKVDRFDENGLSYDGELIINVSEETEIVWQDGEAFEGYSIEGMPLVVFYTISTRSLPPQTPPEKIIVLFERNLIPNQEEQPIDSGIIDGGTDAIIISDSGEIEILRQEIQEIVVEGAVIETVSHYYTDSGVLMIPLRAVVEVLGYTPVWDNEKKSVLLDDGRVSLAVGADKYRNEYNDAITLNAAPENIDGTIYVPLRFFAEVMGLNNAYVFEGQVVIDNSEKFE